MISLAFYIASILVVKGMQSSSVPSKYSSLQLRFCAPVAPVRHQSWRQLLAAVRWHLLHIQPDRDWHESGQSLHKSISQSVIGQSSDPGWFSIISDTRRCQANALTLHNAQSHLLAPTLDLLPCFPAHCPPPVVLSFHLGAPRAGQLQLLGNDFITSAFFVRSPWFCASSPISNYCTAAAAHTVEHQ